MSRASLFGRSATNYYVGAVYFLVLRLSLVLQVEVSFKSLQRFITDFDSEPEDRQGIRSSGVGRNNLTIDISYICEGHS